MDKYSFLNAAHTSFFAEMYERYLSSPDSVEPSWRAFFQGFDFGLESQLDDLDQTKNEIIHRDSLSNTYILKYKL